MQNESYNEIIELNEMTDGRDLFGNNDANIDILEDSLQVKIVTRGGDVSITGNE
ncbi:PhoH family protein, partial [Listeria fleischmannii subsp. coloradonensis]